MGYTIPDKGKNVRNIDEYCKGVESNLVNEEQQTDDAEKLKKQTCIQLRGELNGYNEEIDQIISNLDTLGSDEKIILEQSIEDIFSTLTANPDRIYRFYSSLRLFHESFILYQRGRLDRDGNTQLSHFIDKLNHTGFGISREHPLWKIAYPKSDVIGNEEKDDKQLVKEDLRMLNTEIADRKKGIDSLVKDLALSLEDSQSLNSFISKVYSELEGPLINDLSYRTILSLLDGYLFELKNSYFDKSGITPSQNIAELNKLGFGIGTESIVWKLAYPEFDLDNF